MEWILKNKLEFPVFEEVKSMPKDYLIVIPKNRENKGFSIKYNFDQLKFDVSSWFLNQYWSGIINLKDKKIIQSTVDWFIKIPNECSIDLLLAPYISTPDDLNLNSQLLQSAFEKNIKSFEFYQKNVYSNPILLFIKDLIEHNTTLNKLYLQVYGQEELKEILKMLPNQHNLWMVTIRVIGQVSDKEIYDLCMNYKQKSLSTIIHFWEVKYINILFTLLYSLLKCRYFQLMFLLHLLIIVILILKYLKNKALT